MPQQTTQWSHRTNQGRRKNAGGLLYMRRPLKHVYINDKRHSSEARGTMRKPFSPSASIYCDSTDQTAVSVQFSAKNMGKNVAAKRLTSGTPISHIAERFQ